MAAGKSTIGKSLARELRRPFYDIDELIVRDHGPIETIFSERGEPTFRRYEHDAIASVVNKDPAVLALGGGALTYLPTRRLLSRRAYRIFVKLDPDEIFRRVRRARRIRPLLGRSPNLSVIEELYAVRLPFYAKADFTVAATGLETRRIVTIIIEWMRENKVGF